MIEFVMNRNQARKFYQNVNKKWNLSIVSFNFKDRNDKLIMNRQDDFMMKEFAKI